MMTQRAKETPYDLFLSYFHIHIIFNSEWIEDWKQNRSL